MSESYGSQGYDIDKWRKLIDCRRFGEQQQQQPPPRGFNQSGHRQNERPLRAHDDREGFSPLGSSTPLNRSRKYRRDKGDSCFASWQVSSDDEYFDAREY